jgi:hypothetical protein
VLSFNGRINLLTDNCYLAGFGRLINNSLEGQVIGIS